MTINITRVIAMKKAGYGYGMIARKLRIPYSEVRDIIETHYPNERIKRIRRERNKPNLVLKWK